MKILIYLLIGIALSNAAQMQVVDCEEQYNSCITTCCENCGSYIEYDQYGNMECNAGTVDNVDQQCVDMCMPCSTQYQQCINSGSNDTGSSSCCGSAAILGGLLGFVFIRK